MEELAPKATGREAKIENRRAKSDTIHGGRVGLKEAHAAAGAVEAGKGHAHRLLALLA